MSLLTASPFAIFLDLMMIIYTLWIVSLGEAKERMSLSIGIGMLVWLAILHFVLSTRIIFPEDISGIAFLIVIFVAVGGVGALLFSVGSLRQKLLGLSQRQLLLMQGIRVFFGANFLMQASLGGLPIMFGILDGWTHIGAGFLGLIAAFSLANGTDGVRRAWFANIFGIVDILVVASTLALVSLPTLTPHHTMMYAVFLPAPLWLWFHVVSIWKLLDKEAYI